MFKGTGMPVQTVFLNLEAGMSPKEITGEFDVTMDEIEAVLQFASERLEQPRPKSGIGKIFQLAV